MNGILAYGAYLPAYRLGRDSGLSTPRVVASFDEDATTMAVEAALSLSPTDVAPASLWWASSTPPYLDKTNASAVHAALGLPSSVPAGDLVGTARSTFAALRAARATGGLVVAADVRVGRPGSADERGGGDGAAAVLLGEGPAIAEILAVAGDTAEVLDRWRAPDRGTGEQWEERFGFERYLELARSVTRRVLAEAALPEADHVVITSGNHAITKRASAVVKGRLSTTTSPVGFSGASDPLLGLTAALDVAGPGETILVVSAYDGCDALLVRTTDRLPHARSQRPVAEQLAAGREVAYTTYLSWRGLLEREVPRRPEPDRPAGPPSARAVAWKFGFTGSRCTDCGFLHLPPLRVCRACSAVDRMEPADAGALSGRVATYTIDRLAFSPSPPVVDVVVDFEGGGRTTLEVADADPAVIEVGAHVALAFRRLFTAGNVHNYFWKARVL